MPCQSVYQTLAERINAFRDGSPATEEDARRLYLELLVHKTIEATRPPAELLAPGVTSDHIHASGPLGKPQEQPKPPVPLVEDSPWPSSTDGSTPTTSAPSAELAAPSPQGSVRVVNSEEYKGSVLYVPTIGHVADFHAAFGHPVRTVPTVCDGPTRELRVKLILEEVLELAEAAGVRVTVVPTQQGQQGDKWIHGFEVTHTDAEPDLVEMADAIADIDYLAAGSALVFGLPHCEIIEEVQRANMSKLGEDGKPIYRADGKIMKGPNYVPPDIASIVEGHLRASAQEVVSDAV